MTDPIRAALERLLRLESDNWGTADWDAAITAARAALAAAPEGEGLTDAEIITFWSEHCAGDGDTGIIRLARWGRPATPPAPLEGEVGELVEWLKSLEGASIWFEPGSPEDRNRNRAATLLERQHHLLTLAGAKLDRFMEQQLSASAPAVVPVPVSERLPEAADCAPWLDEPSANPWCWAGKDIDGGWEWAQISMLGLSANTLSRIIAGGGWTHWLPAHAIPLPAPKGGEVKG